MSLSPGCYLTISSSSIPFSSCPQSFLALGSFPMSQLFASHDQSIGASASASVLPVIIQGWFPLGLIGLISFLSKGISRVQLSHLYMTPRKIIAFTRWTFAGKVMSLLFFFFIIFLFFYFTILYWFCHTSTCIMYRTVFWTMWEREGGWFGRMALKHV